MEVNAFGDLLPGEVPSSEYTYTAELRACPPGLSGLDRKPR